MQFLLYFACITGFYVYLLQLQICSYRRNRITDTRGGIEAMSRIFFSENLFAVIMKFT